MPRGSLAMLVLALAAAPAVPLEARQPTAAEREAMYHRYLDFASYVKGGSIEPHWLADGSSFWYTDGDSENTVIWKVDPVANTRIELLDTRDLPEIRAAAQPESSVEAGVPSPDGRWIATVREHNLWLTSAADGREVQLTSDGFEGRGWWLGARLSQERAQWSPDGSLLAAKRIDYRGAPRIPLVDWLGPAEDVAWALFARKPGQAIERSELFLIDVGTGSRVRVDTGEESDQRTFLLDWLPDGSALLLLRLRAGVPGVALLAADPTTGASRVLLTEEHPVRFRTTGPFPGETPFTLLADERQFLWISGRTGWRHLYLYDVSGQLVRSLTDGEFPVERIVRIDEPNGWVYFTARGDTERPYDIHLYRVSLDGQGLARLTEAPGQRDIRFAPSGLFFLDTHSSVDRAPVVELRRADGELLRVLAAADVEGLERLAWRPPEEFVVEAADGTELYGVLYKPFDFDAGRKYPVVLQTSIVARTFPGNRWLQALAQLGFVTFQVDVREPLQLVSRGGEFHRAAAGTMGRIEVPDYVAALHALAARRPYMDLGRVGVFGTSYGGYHAIRAMLQAPEVFHVGIGVNAITDAYGHPNFYVLGSPADNRQAFAEASNLSLAGNLEGRLLLIHGTHDVSVPFSHAMKMADALIRAGRFFDLLVLPNWDHWGDYWGWGPEHELFERYWRDAARRYFEQHLRP